MTRVALALVALAAFGCEEPRQDHAPSPVVTPAEPVAPAAAEEPTPPEDDPPTAAVDAEWACERHAECRVLTGVCGHPAPCNEASVDEVRRRIDALAALATCGRTGIRVEDTTPACVGGACRALLGALAEHRCDADRECVVVDGICGPTEAVREDQREVFQERVDALEASGVGCGYGTPPPALGAICDDSLCVPR